MESRRERAAALLQCEPDGECGLRQRAGLPDYVFQAGGTPLARTIAHVATGGEWAINDHASVFARVSVDLGNHEQNYRGLAGLNWKW